MELYVTGTSLFPKQEMTKDEIVAEVEFEDEEEIIKKFY